MTNYTEDQLTKGIAFIAARAEVQPIEVNPWLVRCALDVQGNSDRLWDRIQAAHVPDPGLSDIGLAVAELASMSPDAFAALDVDTIKPRIVYA